MRRRTFIQTLLAGGAAASSFSGDGADESPCVRFGVVTDSHYAEKDKAVWSSSARHYRDSLPKMRQAVDAFNAAELDFIIELGDMKDMGAEWRGSGETKTRRPAEELQAEAIRFLDAIEAEFARFKGPRYHVLGNHDMDCISKEDFLAHTRNHGDAAGKTHYAFEVKGVKFIVLDGNFNADRTPYCRGNFDWTKAFIPDDQLAWLEGELKRSRTLPTVVFCHQLSDRFSGVSPAICLGNADKVVGILERNRQVRAVIQGHHHSGNYSCRRNIHYWTMKAMIEKPFPAHNSYAIVEINRRGDIRIEGFADCEKRLLPRS
jgi:alkaline phosphatase